MREKLVGAAGVGAAMAALVATVDAMGYLFLAGCVGVGILAGLGGREKTR